MKLDTSKIEGYAEMSAEDKIKALESYEVEADTSGMISKQTFDKTASELAKYKKQYNELLSDDERKKVEANEELVALREKVQAMEQEKTITNNKSQFISLGYDEGLAEETAKALFNGDTTRVFANHKKFLENHDKTLKAEMLKETPIPPAGNGQPLPMTRERFQKLSTEERMEFAQTHPEEYNAIYGG